VSLRSHRARLALTGTVVVAASAATALALAAGGDSPPPTIDADSHAPLFALRGMTPGDPAVERCVAVGAAGGSAPRVLVSATVSGALADDLRMDVAAGQGPAPGDGHSCAGFVPERELWSGALADFPRAGAPAIDAAPLRSGQRHVYRFTVRLPATATATAGTQAAQDIRWTAELDPDPQAASQAPPSQESEGASNAPLRCALVSRDARATTRIAGHTVGLGAGLARVVAVDVPLRLRVDAPHGLVRAVAYRVDGRTVRARPRAPWSAHVVPTLLRAPRTTISATIVPRRGAAREVTLGLAVRPCGTLARAWADGAPPRRLRLRVDSSRELRGASVTLPAAIAPTGGSIQAWANGRRRARRLDATGSQSVRIAGRRIEVSDLPPGTSVVVVALAMPRRARSAIDRARCRRAALAARLATDSGIVTVQLPLIGSRKRCSW
jgi:hypothetical protein